MPIDRKFASAQVQRMGGTEYFNALSDDAVRELARALATSPNEAIAVTVVNEWLEKQTERPTPADLYRAIDRLAAPAKYWKPDYPMGPEEPLTDAERAEIAALQQKITAQVEAKKLKQRAIARGA